MMTVAPEHFGDQVCEERNKVGCSCRPISQWKETDRDALVKDRSMVSRGIGGRLENERQPPAAVGKLWWEGAG